MQLRESLTMFVITKFPLMRSLLVIIFFAFQILFFSCSNTFDGKDGVKTVYFPGSLIVEQTIEYKDGVRNGMFREFYRNGQIKLQQFYVGDTLTDSSLSYYANGKLKSLQYLKHGKREGSWRKYNEEGNVVEEMQYKDNLLDGFATKYTYRSLKLLQKRQYKHGLKNGKQEFYHQNGKPMAVVYFTDNHPCLGTEEWDEKGEKINNDFTISVREENTILVNGKLRFHITLSQPRDDDEMQVISDKDSSHCPTALYNILRENDEFLVEYKVPRGGFVMEKLKLLAIRKTAFGNRFMKTKTIPVAADNF